MSDHSHDPHATDDHGHDAGHESHGGLGQYITVFVALCVLTGASFFTYSDLWPFHDTPAVGWAFMMAVSCTKALLVILFFMHLLWEANWKYVLTLPAMFMSIFLCLMLVPDVGWRLHNASEERWLYMAVPNAEEKTLVHEEQEHAAHEHQHESSTEKKTDEPHAHAEK